MGRSVDPPATASCPADIPPVAVEGPVSPAALDGLAMNPYLTNFRPPERQKRALVKIAGLDPGWVFIARHDGEIVGYVTFHQPDSFVRWIRHPRVLELGGIEVSPAWRGRLLAGRLLSHAFSFPALSNYIVITTEYCWHWDMKGTNLGLWEYRKMLTALFGKVGMVVKPTDDPDIAEHPANVLMTRVGSRVPPADALTFEEMLFVEDHYS